MIASAAEQLERYRRNRGPLRIAMLGTRGIPAGYSGFETCVEELGSRLVLRGHEVTVYNRAHHVRYAGDFYKGIHLVTLPTIPNKYLDTIVHTTFSSLHALTQGYDVDIYFIAGNSLVTWIPRLFGQATILNVDGLDWKRQKWPPLAKRYIQFAEKMATLLPTLFLTDSQVVQRYYREQYGLEPPYIPYGASVVRRPPGEWLERFGLEAGRYVLFVGRLVPENCAHHLVDAWNDIDSDMKCVIVGDAPYAKEYIADLKARAKGNVIFTGYLFGEGYAELSSNAYLFVETSGVGGTHPALLEAMAFGNCVVINGTAENRESIGETGFAYDGEAGAEGLRPLLERLLANPEEVTTCGRKTLARVQSVYSWAAVTDAYEALCYRLTIPAPKIGR